MDIEYTRYVGPSCRAIITRDHGPTNCRGPRISAHDWDGNRVFIPRSTGDENHINEHYTAALALCQKMGWTGDLVAGGIKGGYVFVFNK
jgi:hypothetical protein